MQVWRHPASGRWLALAIGQGDKELPLELLAAVGETPAPGWLRLAGNERS
jgi:hypothetical protein